MDAVKTEAQIKEEVKAVLKDRGAWHFMPHMNGYGRSGIPDFIVCYRGRFIAFETKRQGNKPTAWQNRELDAIGKAQGRAYVVYDAAFVVQVLDAIDGETVF